MKTILLISPPFYRLMGSHYNGMHLGLAYIASTLRSVGHKVIIYNADYSDTGLYLDQYDIYKNFDLYKKRLNFAPFLWEYVELVVKEVNPDYVGIQIYTGTFKSAQMVADIVKKINPKIKVVVGGAHPTLDPEGTKYKNYDYIIEGEGEFQMLDMIGWNGHHDLNVTRMMDKTKIDCLPFPERSPESYWKNQTNINKAYLITSRGCPYECTYCASPKIWNKKVRYRSVENILDELQHLSVVCKDQMIRFQDDTFTANRERTEEICRGIIDRKLNIQWGCITRLDKVNKELLMLMKKSGCTMIKVGVESGSDRILEQIKKNITVSRIRSGVNLIKEVDIPLTVYFMVGFPGETNEDVKASIELAQEINAEYTSLSLVTPYLGTQIFSEAKNLKKPNWEYFYHQSPEMILNDSIDKELIEKFFEIGGERKGG